MEILLVLNLELIIPSDNMLGPLGTLKYGALFGSSGPPENVGPRVPLW